MGEVMRSIFKELEYRACRLLGVAVAGAILLAGSNAAQAQESNSDWRFYFTPYGWMTGFGMETRGVGPVPSNDIDVDFSQVLDHLNMALEGNFEARKGRFVAVVDFNYFSLSADEGLSGPVFTKAALDMTGILASSNVGYQVIDSDPVALDLFAGVQVFSVDVDLAIRGGVSPSTSDTVTLVDPIIGVRGTIDLGSGFFLSNAATIGGFGVDSKLTWQAFGGIGWQANDWLAIRAGYRHFSIEQEGGTLVKSVTMTGPIIGATFRL